VGTGLYNIKTARRKTALTRCWHLAPSDKSKVTLALHVFHRVQFRNKTRMLAINVSIPNLTIARLEQFRSPQLRIQKERPTDVGVDRKQTVLYTKSSCRYLPSESLYAANVVPKLGAMTTSLRPSISAMSSLDSLFPKTHP